MCLADNKYPTNVGYIFPYKAIFYPNPSLWYNMYFLFPNK